MGVERRGRGGGETDVYDGRLPFNADLQFRLRHDDVEVFAFDRGRHGHGDVDVLDRLRPFVGQLGLLGGLSGFELVVFLRAFFGRWGG